MKHKTIVLPDTIFLSADETINGDTDSLDNFGTELEEDGEEKRPSKTRAPGVPEDGEESTCSPKKSFNYIQWTNLGDGVYTHTGRTQKELDPAAYSLFEDNHGTIYLRKENVNSDELIEFKDSITDQILSEIEVFWGAKKIFQHYGFLHRRGYLFYGKAGCGKSGIIYLIINKIIKRGGIVLICESPHMLSEEVKIIRHIEPHKHIVCVFEDIDAIIAKYGENGVLSFLDGESQADDILNIATTNYPERLDKRIVARPRRFDRRIKINPPSASVRQEFFTKKLGITEDIDKWVRGSDGFSFAGMTELVISVKALGIEFEKAVKEINNLIKKQTPSSDSEGEIGFGANNEDGDDVIGKQPRKKQRLLE
jgi:hypothetical protein